MCGALINFPDRRHGQLLKQDCPSKEFEFLIEPTSTDKAFIYTLLGFPAVCQELPCRQLRARLTHSRSAETASTVSYQLGHCQLFLHAWDPLGLGHLHCCQTAATEVGMDRPPAASFRRFIMLPHPHLLYRHLPNPQNCQTLVVLQRKHKIL